MSSISLGIVVIVVSDSRNEQTDKSGKVLEDRINTSGHKLIKKIFLKDNGNALKILGTPICEPFKAAYADP